MEDTAQAAAPEAVQLGDLLDTAGMERRYRKKQGYWNKLRCSGGGPAYYKLGKSVLYDPHVVDAWLASKRRTSTSDDGTDGLPSELRPAPPSGGKPTPPRRPAHQPPAQ